jgi:hypothetical protein
LKSSKQLISTPASSIIHSDKPLLTPSLTQGHNQTGLLYLQQTRSVQLGHKTVSKKVERLPTIVMAIA